MNVRDAITMFLQAAMELHRFITPDVKSFKETNPDYQPLYTPDTSFQLVIHDLTTHRVEECELVRVNHGRVISSGRHTHHLYLEVETNGLLRAKSDES